MWSVVIGLWLELRCVVVIGLWLVVVIGLWLAFNTKKRVVVIGLRLI